MAKKHRADGEGSIRKRKDGRWEVRYMDTREADPSKRRKSITHKSQKVLMEKFRAVQSEISIGEKPLVSANPFLAEWLPLWLREYRRSELRDSTYESYDRHIAMHLLPLLGHIQIKDLTGFHIQQMYNRLQQAKKDGGWGLSAATVLKVRNILSGALQQAVINKLIRYNPVTETRPPKAETPEIRILSKEEQRQFISVLPLFYAGNMFAVALATGMRIGELCALEPNDINREQKYISITKSAGRRKDKYTGEVAVKIGPPKTKHSIRKIPLLPSVEVMLDRQEQLVSELRKQAGETWHENKLVFPTETGGIRDLSGLRTALSRILKRAGLEHTNIHALRHTYATTALNAGVAAQNVAKLLGHKDGATTLHFYAHYIDTEAVTQLEKLEEQNISHLGITAGELQAIVMGTASNLEKAQVSEILDLAVLKCKSLSPQKSAELILSVCEDILCEAPENLSEQDKEILLGTLSRYTILKRQYIAQGKERRDERAR